MDDAALATEVAAEVNPALTVPLMMPVEPMVTPWEALPASLIPIRPVELLPAVEVEAPPFTLVELAPTVAVVAPVTLPDWPTVTAEPLPISRERTVPTEAVASA